MRAEAATSEGKGFQGKPGLQSKVPNDLAKGNLIFVEEILTHSFGHFAW